MGIAPEVAAHYDEGAEQARLCTGRGLLELLRTQDVLRRHLPHAPAKILDVGGGPGTHAEWLAADGHRVHLVDPVPLHVQQANGLFGVRATLGDARALAAADAAYDVVLLCGPLYHLTSAEDRLAAWREAARVARPGGLVAAAVITRYASLFDGISRPSFPRDARYRPVVDHAVETGEHHPPPDTHWFTTAYFHRPEEPAAEARAAGLDVVATVAVEGSAGMLAERDLEAALADDTHRDYLLWALRRTEDDPSVHGASSHLLTLARKPR
ncbi:class I SAM-dependent methyltransferase [Umezawaea endophytica]|uniref:Class I SAM-dependent methyltransferase n=1 Tax=Umezawaea endophytica TaxID=1654476 RepID=A0A9X2VQ67_9PSEU|nr:class I SAM-dependent methyltransferase [Umezawaea endophytica]MCS7480771.1 class I SAM-dependent methyltransferase [Umezawaea endophytica]